MSVSAFTSSFVPMNSNFGQGPYYTAHPNVMSPVRGPRGRGVANDGTGMARRNRAAANLPERSRAPRPSRRSRRREQREASGLDRSYQLTTQPVGTAELHVQRPRKKQRRNRPRHANGDVDVQMAGIPEITRGYKSRDVVMREAPPLSAPRALPPVVVNLRKRDREMRDVPMRDAPPLALPLALPPVIVNYRKLDRQMRNVVMRDAPPLIDDADILAAAFERLKVAQGAYDRDGDLIMADAPPLGV